MGVARLGVTEPPYGLWGWFRHSHKPKEKKKKIIKKLKFIKGFGLWGWANPKPLWVVSATPE